MYDILIRFSGKFKSVGERYRQNSTRNQGRGKGTNRGAELSLTQAATGGALTGKDRVTHAKITCYSCNARGHYSGNCPSTDKRTNGITSLQVGAFLNQCFPSTEDIIDPNWIILDSSSTSTTVKKALLFDIRDCTEDETLLVHTNGGDNIFHQQGELNIVTINAHYDPTPLANILLMKDVRRIMGIRITMDTFEEIAMLIHLSDGNVIKCQECNDRLYYYSMAQGADGKNRTTKYKS